MTNPAPELATLGFSDHDLVHRVAQGQEEAFEALYRRFYPRLVGAVRPAVGEQCLAEDVAQEALLKARDRLASFDISRPFWPWLKTIAIHLAIDHRRRTSREVLVESDLAAECEGSTTCEFTRCDESLLLIEALKVIPPRQRLAIALRYIEQRDPRDAAVVLGLSKPAFEQLLFRARRNLHASYRRLSEEVAGLVLIPRGLRTAWGRLSGRTRRVSEHVAQLVPGGVDQVAQLIIALVIVGGAGAGAGGERAFNGVTSAGEAGAFVPGASTSSGFTAATVADASRVRPQRSGGRSIAPDSHAGGDAADREGVESANIGETARDLTDPNRGVKKPEDALITSIAWATRESQGTSLYASGVAHCRLPSCPSVLFRSANGGATWERLPAEGFHGTTLVVPPRHNLGGTLFAMGPTGLQISQDGGRSFAPAAVAGAPFAVGSAAISPAFDEGDPTILIGAQTLMRYSHDRRTIAPEGSTAVPGPLEPAFSPAYPADPRIVIGGVQPDPVLGRPVSSVFRCRGWMCSAEHVGEGSQVPRVRLDQGFGNNNFMVAFTDDAVFSSTGSGGFTELDTPWENAIIRDVAIDPERDLLFAAVRAIGRSPSQGLYVSENQGLSWDRVEDRLFRHGAHEVEAFGRTVVVGLGRTGVACSSDGGRTWQKRCSS